MIEFAAVFKRCFLTCFPAGGNNPIIKSRNILPKKQPPRKVTFKFDLGTGDALPILAQCLNESLVNFREFAYVQFENSRHFSFGDIARESYILSFEIFPRRPLPCLIGFKECANCLRHRFSFIFGHQLVGLLYLFYVLRFIFIPIFRP